MFNTEILVGKYRRELSVEVHCVKYRKIPNFLVWKFCGKAQFPHSFGRWCGNFVERHSGNCAFPQNFHTRKLGEITVFYAVVASARFWCKVFTWGFIAHLIAVSIALGELKQTTTVKNSMIGRTTCPKTMLIFKLRWLFSRNE